MMALLREIAVVSWGGRVRLPFVMIRADYQGDSMRDHEIWAESLSLAYAEPDAKTGKRLVHAEVLAQVEAAMDSAQNTSVLADDTEIPTGGTLPATPEAEICAALAEAFALSRPEGTALRRDILEGVEEGGMRPADAEMWAARFNWPPFAGWAPFGRFDPRTIPTWTLAQAAAWIAHRESDQSGVYERVSRLDPARIAASTRWVVAGDGHEVGLREDRGYSEPEDERTDAKEELLAALRTGQIVAEGERDGEARTIPAEEWPRLAIVGVFDDEGVHRVVRGLGNADSVDRPTAYDNVRLDRDIVLALWPDPTCETKPLRDAPFEELVVLFRAEIARLGKIPSQKAAGDLFKSLGLRVTQKVRDQVVDKVSGTEAGTRRRGRPPKRPVEKA